MKSMIILVAITFFSATLVNATTYRGTFETEWNTGGYGSRAVTVILEATSDEVNFQIDSMAFQFTDTLQASGSSLTVGSTLDPISVSVDIFTASQLLNFVPGSDIASITPLSLGWDIQYNGIYRKDSTFEVVDTDSQLGIGIRSTDTLFDFSEVGKLTMTFSTSPATTWGLPTLDIPGGRVSTTLSIPTSPVVLSVIPEPTTCGLAIVAAFFLTSCRRRSS